MKLFPLATLALLAAPSALAQKPTDDPLLNAMQQELTRERDLLILPGMQKPYFIEYRLDDFQHLRGRRQLRRAHPRRTRPPAHRPRHRARRRLRLRLQLQPRRRLRRARPRGQRSRRPPLRPLDHHRRSLQGRPARLRRQAGRSSSASKSRPRKTTFRPPNPSSRSSPP